MFSDHIFLFVGVTWSSIKNPTEHILNKYLQIVISI